MVFENHDYFVDLVIINSLETRTLDIFANPTVVAHEFFKILKALRLRFTAVLRSDRDLFREGDFEVGRFHLRRLALGVLTLDVGVKGSIGSICLSALLRTDEFLFDLIILPATNSAH